MEKQIIFLDTSILIDYFRKTDKSNSLLVQLTDRYDAFATSVITEYEIYAGCNEQQLAFWNEFFASVKVLPFTSKTGRIAAKIYQNLKRQNQLIGVPDIFIAATAFENKLPIATLNTGHFSRVDNLELIAE